MIRVCQWDLFRFFWNFIKWVVISLLARANTFPFYKMCKQPFQRPFTIEGASVQSPPAKYVFRGRSIIEYFGMTRTERRKNRHTNIIFSKLAQRRLLFILFFSFKMFNVTPIDISCFRRKKDYLCHIYSWRVCLISEKLCVSCEQSFLNNRI